MDCDLTQKQRPLYAGSILVYSSRFRTKPFLLKKKKKKKKPKHSAKVCSDFGRRGRTSRETKEEERLGGRKADEEDQAVGP